MKFLAKLEKKRATWFLIITAFLFFLLRLPSLFEPLWYGDEGVYEVIGSALNKGRHLYTGIWDNKPPLLYYIYAIFNGNQASVRLFSLLFGLASVFVFFYLSKKLFQNQKIEFITTGIFAFLFATPFLEGNIANAENFMILPTLVAALLIIKTTEQKINLHHTKQHHLYAIRYTLYAFFAGLLLGISFLIKVVA